MSSLCLTKHNIMRVWVEIDLNAFLASETEKGGCCGISSCRFTLREMGPRTQWFRYRVETRSGLNGVENCWNDKWSYSYIIFVITLQVVWTNNPAVSCVGHYPNVGGSKGRPTRCTFRFPQRSSGKIWNGAFHHVTILSMICLLSFSDGREYLT